MSLNYFLPTSSVVNLLIANGIDSDPILVSLCIEFLCLVIKNLLKIGFFRVWTLDAMHALHHIAEPGIGLHCVSII